MIFLLASELLALVVRQPFAISANAASICGQDSVRCFFEEGPLQTSSAEYYIRFTGQLKKLFVKIVAIG